MKKERVNQIIDRLSAGNSDLGLVMRLAYSEGRAYVDKWGDEKDDLCTRRFIRVTSCLIRRRIEVNTISRDPVGYWQTEKGKKVEIALSEFIKKRKIIKKVD